VGFARGSGKRSLILEEFSGSGFNGCGLSGKLFNREPHNCEPLNHATPAFPGGLRQAAQSYTELVKYAVPSDIAA
jgi:hypothetical protein